MGTREPSPCPHGSQLVQLKVDGNTLFFTYDAQGIPATVNYNGTLYYYITNLQGDVTSIVDANGTTQILCTYSAYGLRTHTIGNVSSGIGLYNPFWYRGYVYDSETGMYYLQSRYYDPMVGRFINGDDIAYLGIGGLTSYNLFAYCNNAPINNSDPCGTCVHNGKWFVDCELCAASSVKERFWYFGETIVSKCPKNIQQAINYTNNFVEGVKKITNSGEWKILNGAANIVSGVRLVVSGASLLLAPIPTEADDIVGVAKATYGILKFAGGITKVIVGVKTKLEANS